MKEILKQIIKTYFEKKEISKIFDFKLELKDELLIIYNKYWEEVDFFYFIFDKGISEDIKPNIIFEELIEKSKKLKEIESFDKNLNFIYFFKLDNYSDKKDYLNKEYEIIQHPLYAKNKVIFYDDDLINNFDNYKLNLDSIKDLENLTLNDKFLLNLIVSLSFIKIDFWTEEKSVEKNIFKNSFNYLNKEYNILDTKVKILDNYKNFNQKIIDLNNYDDLLWGITNINKWITNFEKELLGLFWEGRDELEKSLLQYSDKKDEKEIKELFWI